MLRRRSKGDWWKLPLRLKARKNGLQTTQAEKYGAGCWQPHPTRSDPIFSTQIGPHLSPCVGLKHMTEKESKDIDLS
jgi:hypothetical protein